MELKISMDAVLNFLHSLGLATSNKQWLADHLYEEVRAEKEAQKESMDANEDGWPKIRREDMHIATEVADLVKGFELPEDADYDQLKLDYLMKNHHHSQQQ